MDGSRLNTFMGRRFHPTRLERVVANVAEQRTGEGGRGVDKRWHLALVVLDQHLGDAALVRCAQTGAEEHVAKGQEEHSEEKRHHVPALQGGDGQQESDGHEGNEQHLLGFFTLHADGFALHLDDAVAAASRNRANAWFVFVLLVGIDEHVLQGVFWQQFRHRACEHGLARPGVPNHQHVAALFGRLADDDRPRLLANDLVDQAVWDGDVAGGREANLVHPLLDRGLKHRIARVEQIDLLGSVLPHGRKHLFLVGRKRLVSGRSVRRRVLGLLSHASSCARLPFEAFSRPSGGLRLVHWSWSRYCCP